MKIYFFLKRFIYYKWNDLHISLVTLGLFYEKQYGKFIRGKNPLLFAASFLKKFIKQQLEKVNIFKKELISAKKDFSLNSS